MPDRREIVRRAAQEYLDEGYLIARDDERGIALAKPKDFNWAACLIASPLYILYYVLAKRDKYVFLTATAQGEVIRLKR